MTLYIAQIIVVMGGNCVSLYSYALQSFPNKGTIKDLKEVVVVKGRKKTNDPFTATPCSCMLILLTLSWLMLSRKALLFVDLCNIVLTLSSRSNISNTF